MKAIAIMNLKGGVGKTGTTINLAEILSERGKRVLLVDCDGQMNLTRFYFPGFDPNVTTTVADVLQGDGEHLWSDNVIPCTERISLLPASSELYALDIAAVKHGLKRPRALMDFQLAVKGDGDVDYIIYDCPPGFTAASVAALLEADEIVIPMLVDGFSMQGVDDLLAQIKSIICSAPAGVRLVGVLIVQWHNAEVVHQGEALLRSLPVKVFKTVIKRSDKVPESTFARKPTVGYSPRSIASLCYRDWVDEYLGKEL